VRIAVKNHGKTPGTVTRVHVEGVIGATLPAIPEYKDILVRPPQEAILMPGERFIMPKEGLSGALIPVGGLQGQHLWVIGYVEYKDRFQRRHRSGYARRYNPDQPENNLGIEGQFGYNDDIEIDENGQPKKPRKSWRYYADLS
jgi:hypothetical protein